MPYHYYSCGLFPSRSHSLKLMGTLLMTPSGAWIALPSYMVYVFGQEILEGLALASNESIDSEPARDLLAIKNE